VTHYSYPVSDELVVSYNAYFLDSLDLYGDIISINLFGL
jgi:hypothetical protein